MKLESVAVSFPSRKLTNDDIVGLVEEESKLTFHGDLNRARRQIGLLLGYSGASERRWLDKGEDRMDHIVYSVKKALESANCSKKDIDLLIYAGVDRRFREGDAIFVAKAIGMKRIECFDILDACMSWTTAAEVAYAFLNNQRYRHIMIVSAEFNQTRENGPGYPALFRLRNLEQLKWTFPGYTVGEAATATILSHDPERKWEFSFSPRPDLADLCTIPLPGYESYCTLSDKIGRNGPGRFTSFGREMYEYGKPEAVNVFRELSKKVPTGEIKAIFPHTSSKRDWDTAAKEVGAENLLYHIYPKYGNVVSASVPAGMALSIEEGRIQRGDRVAGWMASAGMSFAAYSFAY